MYKVTLYDRGSYPNGGQVLLDTSSQNTGVSAASYEGKLNEAGSFTFTVVATHPLCDSIEALKTYVSVEEEGTEIFWGRVIMVRKSPLTGTKQVTCEGAWAFLMDAELAPDSDNVTRTPADYFRYCIAQYNEQIGNDPARALTVGTIDVDGSATSTPYKNGNWTQIQSVIKSKIVDQHDGFVSIVKSGTGHVINWVKQVGVTNPQEIRLGSNVVNQNSSESGEDVFTYVRSTGKDNLTYGPVQLSAEMEAKYGKIIRTISFGNIDTAAALQTKTNEYIAKLRDRLSLSVDLNFVDMHYVDGTAVKVHLGDVFTNLSGYEGTRYTAAALTRDLLNPANDKMTPKTDKDLMPSISSSGANSGSSSGGSGGGRRSLSSGSSHWYKHIHETEEDLSLTAKNIQISVEDRLTVMGNTIDIHTQNLSSLSIRTETVEGKWTTFEGTGLYQNQNSINAVAGKFQVDSNGTLLLRSGTQFKIDGNGSATNVGHLLVVHDNRVDDVGQLLASYQGSYSYQNDSELGAIVGRYHLNTMVDPTNPWTDVTPTGTTDGINPKENGWYVIDTNNRYVRTTDETVVANEHYYIPNTQTKVVFDTGGGYKIRENGVEYGVYTKIGDNAVLTGGIIVEKLNDNSTTTKIRGDRVIIGDNQLTDDDLATWAQDADNGTGVFAKFLTVKRLTAQEITTMLADIGSATIEDISTIGDVTVGGTLYVDVEGESQPMTVRNISIIGNTMYIDYVSGNQETFSKATTLEAAVSSGSHKITINAKQQNGNVNTTVATYDVQFGGSFSSSRTTLELVGNGTPSVETVLGAKTITVPVVVNALTGASSQPTPLYPTTISVNPSSILEAKTGANKITSNGPYTPGDGKIGFSSVVVDVNTSTTLGGQWSNGTLTVTASPQGTTQTFGIMDNTSARTSWSADKKTATVSVYAVTGSSETAIDTGKRLTVDATQAYSQGYSDTKIRYECDTDLKLVRVVKTNISGYPNQVNIAVGAAIDYNATTHKYTAKASGAGTQLDTSESGTEAYEDGWEAAYGDVSLPTTGSAASFSVTTPSSTVDGTANTTTYTLSNATNDIVRVTSGSGTVVGQISHGKYTQGQTDLINAGGAVSKTANDVYTLNQYVTTLTVNVANSTALTGEWSGTVAAGKSYKVTASPQGTTHYSPVLDDIYTSGSKVWAADYKSFSQKIRVQDANGEDLLEETMSFVTTDSYNQGYNDTKLTYTASGSTGVLEVSKSSTTGSTSPLRFVIGSDIDYDSSSHKYTAKAYCDDDEMDSVPGGTEAYEDGIDDCWTTVGIASIYNTTTLPSGATVAGQFTPGRYYRISPQAIKSDGQFHTNGVGWYYAPDTASASYEQGKTDGYNLAINSIAQATLDSRNQISGSTQYWNFSVLDISGNVIKGPISTNGSTTGLKITSANRTDLSYTSNGYYAVNDIVGTVRVNVSASSSASVTDIQGPFSTLTRLRTEMGWSSGAGVNKGSYGSTGYYGFEAKAGSSTVYCYFRVT